MTPARRVRWVGVIGLGLSYDALRGTGITSQNDAHAFLNSETGLELDFDGVLLGITAQQTIASDAASLGAGVRVGYGTW